MKVKQSNKEIDYYTAYRILKDAGCTFNKQSYSFEGIDRSLISSVMFRTKYPIKADRNNARTFYKYLQKLRDSEKW